MARVNIQSQIEPLLLTPEQAAEALQVPLATIENQIRVSALPSVMCGKHRRVRLRDLQAYVEGLESK